MKAEITGSELIDCILRLEKPNTFLLFLGAGASRSLGLWLVHEMVNDLLKKLYYEREIKHTKPI